MLGFNIGGNRGGREIVTAVEIGTHSVKVVMGEFSADGTLSIIGAGQEKSYGKVMKGEILDVAAVQEPLMKAMQAAEESANGTEIQNIFLAVNGAHLGSVNSIGSTIIRSTERYVSEQDKEDAITNAYNYPMRPDQEVLHCSPRFFRVDGREVDNPIGLHGGKLEADAHIVYGQHTRFENSRNVINDIMGAGEQEPRGLVFSPIAAAAAMLSREDARRNGVLVIDIGAGVTGYGVFAGGEDHCLHSGQIAVGCEHIANDLSLGLQFSIVQCRDILEKLPDICAKAVMTPDGRARETPVSMGVGRPDRNLPVSTIEQVIEMRVQELFQKIMDDLSRRDMLKRIGGGIRLCGGGALIPQIADLARRVFEVPAEVGCARLVNGPAQVVKSPLFVTAIGTLRIGRQMLGDMEVKASFGQQVWGDLINFRQLLADFRRAFRW